MVVTTALTVVVIGVGGPHSVEKRRTPASTLPGALIEVVEPSTGLEASSRFGELELQLEPGTYVVTARLAPGRPACGNRSVRVRLGRRPAKVRLVCGIK